MKQSELVRVSVFKTIGIWVSYALLARENHNLSMDISISGAGSAHFKEDCFECLSPRNILA